MTGVQTCALPISSGVNVRFNTVLTRNNYRDVPHIVALANEYATEVNFFYMRTIGRGARLFDESLSFEEHYESANDTLRLRESYPELRIMHFEQSFTERSVLPDAAPAGLRFTYPYGSTTFSIAWDGSYWPHGYSPYQDERLLLGRYPQDSILDIWVDSDKLDGMREWFGCLIARCVACPEYRKRCAGLNFEMELARAGGHVTKNPFCISNEAIPSLWGIIK